MKTLLLGGFAALLTAGLALALSEQEDHVVQINGKAYSPDRLEIQVGERVTWKNYDLTEHTVTSLAKTALPQAQEKGLFDSGPMKPGDSFDFRFEKEGTYEYSCKNHKAMSGVVVVKPAR